MGGKGKGGKGGPPPPPAAGYGKTKEELEAEKKAKREAEKAASEERKAAELAHVKMLEEIPMREAADWRALNADSWSGVKKQILLAGGTSIVEMADGKLVCLRRCANASSEFIATHVAAALGVKTPNYRLVSPGEDEYASIAAMAERTNAYLLDMPMTFEGFVTEMKDACGGFIPTESKIPLVEQLELTDPKRSSALLDCSDKAPGTIAILEFLPGRGLHQCCGTLTGEELESFGSIGALNSICNRSDSVCLPVWRESGKLANIMKLNDESANLVAIDSSVNVIAEKQDDYIQMLRDVAAQLAKPDDCKGPQSSPSQIATENLELLKKGGFDIPDEAMAKLVEGVRNGFKKIASSWSSGELEKVIKRAEDQADASKFVPWSADASSPKAIADFLRGTAAAVADGFGPS